VPTCAGECRFVRVANVLGALPQPDLCCFCVRAKDLHNLGVSSQTRPPLGSGDCCPIRPLTAQPGDPVTRFRSSRRIGCRWMAAQWWTVPPHQRQFVCRASFEGSTSVGVGSKPNIHHPMCSESPPPDSAHGSRRLASRFRELAAVRSVDAVNPASRPTDPPRHGRGTGSRTGMLRI
jgi:hypothetical protein